MLEMLFGTNANCKFSYEIGTGKGIEWIESA